MTAVDLQALSSPHNFLNPMCSENFDSVVMETSEGGYAEIGAVGGASHAPPTNTAASPPKKSGLAQRLFSRSAESPEGADNEGHPEHATADPSSADVGKDKQQLVKDAKKSSPLKSLFSRGSSNGTSNGQSHPEPIGFDPSPIDTGKDTQNLVEEWDE